MQPLEEAALIPAGKHRLITGLERAGFDPHTNLLILGTGPISLGGMACAKAMGIGKTIVAGRKDAKLEVAKKLGADITVNMTRENLLDIVMRETDGPGMDIVMDSTGAPELLNDAMFMLRGSGSLVIPAFYEQVLNVREARSPDREELHADRRGRHAEYGGQDAGDDGNRQAEFCCR